MHYPHPEDAELICGSCRDEEARKLAQRPGDGTLLDRRLDRAVREELLAKAPDAFDEGVLWPNSRYNSRRRLCRDWDQAITRILMGHSYRRVSRDIGCSVGLLHRKVKERRHWEDN